MLFQIQLADSRWKTGKMIQNFHSIFKQYTWSAQAKKNDKYLICLFIFNNE